MVDEAFNGAATVLVLAAYDVSFNNTKIYLTQGGYGIRLGSGGTVPTRVTLNNIRVEPFSGNRVPINTIWIAPGAVDTRLINVSTDPNGGGDILDQGTNTVMVNVNGKTNFIGSVGIGTSTPYSKLTVWGPDSASSTLAFNVVNNASTTVFAVFDGGNAQLSGTLTQSSDQRLKTNVQSLDASTTLALISQLNPVTFNWIDTNQGGGPQVGFIAQDVQKVFPSLVSTTSATALTPNGTLGLNYIGLIAPLVSAVQALYTDVQNLLVTVQGFAHSFASDTITANQQLCVSDGPSDQIPVCVTKTQLAALLAGNGSGGNQPPPAAQPSPAAGSNPPKSVTWNSVSSTPAGSATSTPPVVSTVEPPVIQIDGANPAIIHVGDTYADLGATITAPLADLNLGVHTFVGSTPMDQAVIDTSAPATYHINYVATDQNGLTSTSTRTIIIEAAPSASAGEATSTPATTATTTPVSSPAASAATTTNATSIAQ